MNNFVVKMFNSCEESEDVNVIWFFISIGSKICFKLCRRENEPSLIIFRASQHLWTILSPNFNLLLFNLTENHWLHLLEDHLGHSQISLAVINIFFSIQNSIQSTQNAYCIVTMKRKFPQKHNSEFSPQLYSKLKKMSCWHTHIYVLESNFFAFLFQQFS